MSSAIDALLGESTTTGSMPTVVGGSTVIAPRSNRFTSRLAALRRRRRPVSEADDSEGVIPSDAKPDGDNPAAKAGSEPAKKPLPANSSFIPTSVALVAPDYTPDAEAPLSPTQVPPSQKALEPDSDSVLRTLLGAHQAQFKPGLISNTPPPADPTSLVAATIESMTPTSVAESKAKEAAARAVAEATAGGTFEVPIVQPGSAAKISAAFRMINGQ